MQNLNKSIRILACSCQPIRDQTDSEIGKKYETCQSIVNSIFPVTVYSQSRFSS